MSTDHYYRNVVQKFNPTAWLPSAYADSVEAGHILVPWPVGKSEILVTPCPFPCRPTPYGRMSLKVITGVSRGWLSVQEIDAANMNLFVVSPIFKQTCTVLEEERTRKGIIFDELLLSQHDRTLLLYQSILVWPHWDSFLRRIWKFHIPNRYLQLLPWQVDKRHNLVVPLVHLPQETIVEVSHVVFPRKLCGSSQVFGTV